MKEMQNYNLNLTQRPFEGDFRRGRGAKVIYDAHDKILGSVSKKKVFDLNGEEIAFFVRIEKKEDSSKKNNKIRLYTVDCEGEEKDGFYLSDGRLYTVSGEDEMLLGTYEVTERDPVRIALLAVLAVFLALFIAFVTIINLPFEGRPVIDVKDENGAWEAQGVIAVFDDKVLPGSNGEYSFVIRNSYEVSLDYSFSLTPKYDGIDIADIDYFPLTFRLKMNNALIQTDRWLTVDELSYAKLSMMPQSDQSFTLEWRWAMDGGSNYGDTLIGSDGGKISIVLNLTAQQGGNAL